MTDTAKAVGTLASRIKWRLLTSVWDDEREQYVDPAYTIAALAQELEAETDDVAAALAQLYRKGVVTRRQHRSGAVLWKWKDEQQELWDAQKVAL